MKFSKRLKNTGENNQLVQAWVDNIDKKISVSHLSS